MDKKSISENMPIGEILSLGWKAYMELLEAETPGFFGKLSCLWIKLVVIGYLAAPFIILLLALLPLPEYDFEQYLSFYHFVLYLIAAFPLLLAAFIPHMLVFAVQSSKAESKIRDHQEENIGCGCALVAILMIAAVVIWFLAH